MRIAAILATVVDPGRTRLGHISRASSLVFTHARAQVPEPLRRFARGSALQHSKIMMWRSVVNSSLPTRARKKQRRGTTNHCPPRWRSQLTMRHMHARGPTPGAERAGPAAAQAARCFLPNVGAEPRHRRGGRRRSQARPWSAGWLRCRMGLPQFGWRPRFLHPRCPHCLRPTTGQESRRPPLPDGGWRAWQMTALRVSLTTACPRRRRRRCLGLARRRWGSWSESPSDRPLGCAG